MDVVDIGTGKALYQASLLAGSSDYSIFHGSRMLIMAHLFDDSSSTLATLMACSLRASLTWVILITEETASSQSYSEDASREAVQ